MKRLILLAVSICIAQLYAQEKTFSIPFYFALPEYSHLKIDDSYTKIPIRSMEIYKDENGKNKIIKMKEKTQDKLYLRGYFYEDDSSTGRKKALQELYRKNLIQTGDVILSFRPSWTNTIPYAHIQMGVSHAGIAYIENGEVKNLDRPLTEEYISSMDDQGNLLPLFSSTFDSEHYRTAPFIHILRPRNFTKEKQENLLNWINKLKENFSDLSENKLIEFNSDYAKAKYDSYSKKDSFVTKMARIFLKLDLTSTDLSLYCSEQVWALLSLAECKIDDAEILNPQITDASCVKPIFTPMELFTGVNTPGLTDGPITILEAMDGLSIFDKNKLLNVLFSQGDVSRLSAGHAAMAENPDILSLIKILKKMYKIRLMSYGLSPISIPKVANTFAHMYNYSPTSFLINALLPDTVYTLKNNSEHADDSAPEVRSPHPQRRFDYVGTVVFGDLSKHLKKID